MKKKLLLITVFFIVWRVVLFIVADRAGSLLPYQASFPRYEGIFQSELFPAWLYNWSNFDGIHYRMIAIYGYIGTGLVQAFFPLFPFIFLHGIYPFLPKLIYVTPVGILVSNIFAYLLAIVWFFFIEDIFDTGTAWIALTILFLFPTALFFGALYTESLFLFVVIAAFYAARKKHWVWAAFFTLLAATTRIVGIFLIPALVIELWQQQHFRSKNYPKLALSFLKKEWRKIAMLTLGLSGVAIYMLFLNHEFHDPLYFFHIQSSFGGGRQSSLVLYPQVFFRYLKILLTVRPFDFKYYAYVQEFVFGSLGFVVVLATLWKTHFSYAFFSFCAFFLPTLTGTFSSLPRYALVCFSIFLLMAPYFKKHRMFFVLYLCISIPLLLLNTVLFLQGYWVA